MRQPSFAIFKIRQIVQCRIDNLVNSFLGEKRLVGCKHNVGLSQKRHEIGILNVSRRPILEKVPVGFDKE